MIKNLKVKIYHDKEGRQVCSKTADDARCMFLRTKGYGTRFICAVSEWEVSYSGSPEFIRPSANCPVRKDAR